MPFNSVTRANLSKSDEVKALHPLGKLPVAVMVGRACWRNWPGFRHISNVFSNVPIVPLPRI